MNKSAKALCLIILTLSCFISSLAQNKIAFVNKQIFSDEKIGIRELVEANKNLDAEFEPLDKELQSLSKKLQEIVIRVKTGHEYRNKKLTQAEIKKKSEENFLEVKKLSNEIHSKGEKAKNLHQKRKIELIIPINKKISEKLKEFTKQNGYEKIFDLSENELEDSDLLYTNDPIDVTEEFIKFCNEEFEKEKIQKQ